MDTSELKSSARDSLETLYDIAEKIESALADQDDYWTWAGFYKDKKDELMPVKDRGQEAVQRLQESVEGLREQVSSGEYDDLFREIDERKESVREVVDEIRDSASLKTVAVNGEKLADLLEDLLDRFRETSESVEDLLSELNE
jgi:uncharacterized protein YukE